MRRVRFFVVAVVLIVLTVPCLWAGGKQEAEGKINLRFAYPVELAGPLAKLINDLTVEFSAQNPTINTTPIYAGTYWETMDKVKVMVLGGNPPDVAVLAKVNLLALIDIDSIVPVDEYVKKMGGDAYVNEFFPGFLTNSRWNGQLWSIPYQMSVPLLYFNQDAYREVGLDPGRAPDTWDELRENATKLVATDAAGNVERWGIEILTADHWMPNHLVLQNGGTLENEAGNVVYFDDPVTIEAIQWWADLVNKWKVAPAIATPGVASADFVKGATAMMYHSTGTMTFVRKNITSEFNVAVLPKGKVRASASGGGTLCIFKDIPKQNQDAAWEFIAWMTSEENSAQWSRDTGYIAVKKAAWELPVMKQYTAEVPQALVALKALEYVQRELMPHSFPEVAHLLVTAVQDALAGKVSVRDVLTKAQGEAMKVLEPFKE